MLSFFKRKNLKKEEIKRTGGDSSFSSEQLTGQKDDNTSDEEVETELSLHPEWNLREEEKYVYKFLSNECKPLKPNQLSISGIELQQEEENIRASAFVRSSLNQPIQLTKLALQLVGPNNELLGRKVFSFREIGKLPPRSNRPWHFIFEKEDMYTDKIPNTGWKLEFEKEAPHTLDLEKSWEQSLSDKDKETLRKIVNDAQPPNRGEVNFMGVQATQGNNGNLHVTILIRNGNDKTINLQQIPIEVKDATGDVIAKGGFSLDNLEVKANTSKPWTFIFPKSLLLKENVDLSSWSASPII